MAIFTQGHALIVGVGNYQTAKYSVPITYQDGKGVYEALISPNVCAYPSNQVAKRASLLNDCKAVTRRA